MIKKIQIELCILILLLLNILISSVFNISVDKEIYHLNLALENKNLKDFFIKITELGNSLWFFLTSSLFFIFCYLVNKRVQNKEFVKNIKIASLFLFISVLITGILTQLIKHLVGRPRPNHANEVGSFDFNFLSLDSGFHSFPSGHTSTIFIVALVLSILTPKIKYFYLFLALLVGLSRVVVGAHYLTDVIGGIMVAIIGLKLTLFFFNNFNQRTKVQKKIKFNPNMFYLNLIIFFLIIVFLTVGSSLDIYIAGLFYNENKVFVLQSFSYATILAREIFLPFVILYILVFPIISLYFPINKIYLGFKFNIKKILFLWASISLMFVSQSGIALLLYTDFHEHEEYGNKFQGGCDSNSKVAQRGY